MYPKQYGFDIAFGLDKPMNASYGYLQFQQIIYRYETINGTTVRNKYKTTIPITKCGNNFFQGFNQTKVNMYGIPSLYCINSTEIALQGDYYSSEFKYMTLRLFKCQNTTKSQICKSQSEIDAFFTNTKLSVPMVNSYFDFSDYTVRPMDDLENVETVGSIKQFIDDRYFFQIEHDKQKMSNVYLMLSEADLQDDYL